MKKLNGFSLTGTVFALLAFIYMVIPIVFYFVILLAKISEEDKKVLKIVSISFFILGICFLVAALILFVMSRKKKNREKKLINDGHFKYAVVSNFVQNELITVNMKHPFNLICTYKDDFSGETETYVCKNVLKVDEKIIGSTVKVYFDPENKNNYFVDLGPAVK